MTSIAIIPARGGSKRILRKNLKEMNGIPVIAYPIELALKSGLFEKVIVTTDDTEIAELSIALGAEVPFLRSAELSDDFAVTIDVICDAIEFEKKEHRSYEFACCIYPVTPLLNIHRILQAYEILRTNQWDYVFPAIQYGTPIERGFQKSSNGQIVFNSPEFLNTRTQDINPSFHDSGQFYFGTSEAWLAKRSILGGNSTFIELSKNETFDIDDEEDWNLVESIVCSKTHSSSEIESDGR